MPDKRQLNKSILFVNREEEEDKVKKKEEESIQN